MNLQLLLSIWAAAFCAWATVALMRYQLGKREDDHIHFSDNEQQMLVAQSALANKLDVLDRWKNALMILTILIGVLAAAVFGWHVWQRSTSTIQVG